MTVDETALAQIPRPFWKRSIADPVIAQVKQGTSPEKLALTLAVGAAIAVFPVLGTSTTLCIVAGALLKLNQPLLQLVNYLLYPAQIALILVFIRIGEALFRAPHVPFSIVQLIAGFRESPALFFSQFAMTLAHGAAAWLLTALPAAAILYFLSRPLFYGMAQRLRRSTPSAVT